VAADKVAGLYGLDGDGYLGFYSGERLISFGEYSTKIYSCGSWLKFAQMSDGKLKLINARFCHVPNCPMCQWRRSLVWRAKFLSVLPKIREAYPTHRWVFLTLTLKNCKMSELKQTIKHMSQSYKRMRALADYQFEGYIRSLEITRVWDWYDQDGTFLGRHGTTWYYRSKEGDKHTWRAEPTDYVHPHYHVLALVPSGYFKGSNYVKAERWSEMWGQSLRVNYDPIIHIKTVKSSKKGSKNPLIIDELDQDDSGMIEGLCETLKYTIKEQDLIGSFCQDDITNSSWLKQLTEQLYLMRRIEYSGILKEFGKEVKEEENNNENLIRGNEENTNSEKVERELVFTYRAALEKYVISSFSR
jgi:plasmid rolling circle replication initiator protein Rep